MRIIDADIPTAIDLFAGAGGATQGLMEAGFRVLAAIENDLSAAASYKANHPEVWLEARDITQIDQNKFRRALGLKRSALSLLKACPPCQGHSSLNRIGKDDPRNELISYVWLFVREFKPKVVLLENVPRIQNDFRLLAFIEQLASAGYNIQKAILDARDFGVPQRRKRFILMAVRGKTRKRLSSDFLETLEPSFFRNSPTLKGVFNYDSTKRARLDPLQSTSKRSLKVLQRIKAIPVNGDRFDLPPKLRLSCHNRLKREATASYARMNLEDGFAPTMTTRCTSPSCGAFIHPTKNRSITLREASLIQTFPRTYRFKGNYTEVERQIGNAVPVRMARGLGLIARTLIEPRI